MSKNQPISSVDVIPSDTINIPEPGSYLSGASSTNNLTLTTAGAKFVDGTSSVGKYQVVAGGDVVIAGAEMALITSVTSNTTLTLQAPGITAAAPYNYKIHRGNGGIPGTNEGNSGYSLYVGGTGDVTAITQQGEEIVMKNIGNASFIPQQVIRVKAAGTTASDIKALS